MYPKGLGYTAPVFVNLIQSIYSCSRVDFIRRLGRIFQGIFVPHLCFLLKVLTFYCIWFSGSQLPFEDSRMLKEPLQIQPALHSGINLQLTNLHSQQVRLGSELWIQHHGEIMGWGKSLELCPLLSVLCFQGKPGLLACQSQGKLPV